MFPRLNVLDDIVARVSEKQPQPLRGVTLVATQHLLESTGSLFKALLDLGLPPERCYVQGKLYSNNVTVIEGLKGLGLRVRPSTCAEGRGQFAASFKRDIAGLWATVIESLPEDFSDKVIVLDDGGHCLTSVPRELLSRATVIGVEQTTSGLPLQDQTKKGLPIIQVALSAVKRYIEPPMISQAVLEKLRARAPLTSGAASCGVVGLGHIGSAIARDLFSRGHRVFAYDKNDALVNKVEGVVWCKTLKELFERSEYIFGCTGKDILAGADWIMELEGCKTLLSCSSEDKEFRTLLKRIGHGSCAHEGHHLQDLPLELPSAYLTVLRGGFPINFDGNMESVPSQDIQITRGLLLGAVLQASMCASLLKEHGKKSVMLDPQLQTFIVKAWLAVDARNRDRIDPNYLSEGWMKKHSDGDDLCCGVMGETFKT